MLKCWAAAAAGRGWRLGRQLVQGGGGRRVARTLWISERHSNSVKAMYEATRG